MKRLLVALALAGVTLGAAGCSGCSTIIRGDRGVLSQTVVDEKALYGAEAAFYGANTAAESAVDAGLLKPGSPTALKVADGLQEAHAALVAARAAYAAGDAKSYGDKLLAVQKLVADAWAIIPKKKDT